MAQAFNLACVMDKCQSKIECVEPWGDSSLIVGTTEGSLLLISVRPTAPGSTEFTSSCVDSNRTVSKRAVVQLAALEDLGILVALSQDGPITVHELGRGFPLRSTLNKTKSGCGLFAIERSGSSTVVLAAALKRKIAVFTWEGSQFVETRDLTLADGAKTLAWAGPGAILVGSRREYSLIDAQTGGVTPLFPTGKSASSNPFALRIPDGLLVSRDNVSVFLNLEGGAAREHGVSWTEPPVSFVFAFPYIVALLPKHAEVRMSAASASSFAQMIQVKGGKCLSLKAPSATDQPIVYIASVTSIYRLVPIPAAQQIDALVADREFDTALALCESMPAGDPLKATKLRGVRVSYAYNLYAQGQYRRSLELFADLRVDIVEVIGLYPGLLPAGLRRSLRKAPIDTLELVGAARDNAIKALCSYLVQLRPHVCTAEVIAQRIAAAQQEVDGDYNVVTLVPTVLDTTLLKVCLMVGDEKRLTEVCAGPNACHVKEAAAALVQANRFPELVQLYRSKQLHAKALELLAAPTSPLIDPAHTVKYLRRLGARHKDLVFAYSQRVLRAVPDLALTIFTEGERDDPADPELPHADVLAFLKAKAPNSTVSYLEFIIQRRGETGSEFHDELAFQYLEKIKRLREADGGASRLSVGPAGSEPGILGKTRAALLRFLETSEHYRPEALLTGERIPVGDLFEERAIVLSKIGNHSAALAIYALDLGNARMAEEYCGKHFREDREECKDVYLNLLQVYLRPPPATAPAGAGGATKLSQSAPQRPREPMIEPALALLSKHYQRINISEALSLLPPGTQLYALMPFFERVLRETARKRREGQVIRALLRGESLRVREEHILARSPAVRVDESCICTSCGKPLRSSAFARYPDTGNLVHLMCLKNPTTSTAPASSSTSAAPTAATSAPAPQALTTTGPLIQRESLPAAAGASPGANSF